MYSNMQFISSQHYCIGHVMQIKSHRVSKLCSQITHFTIQQEIKIPRTLFLATNFDYSNDFSFLLLLSKTSRQSRPRAPSNVMLLHPLHPRHSLHNWHSSSCVYHPLGCKILKTNLWIRAQHSGKQVTTSYVPMYMTSYPKRKPSSFSQAWETPRETPTLCIVRDIFTAAPLTKTNKETSDLW